MCAVPKRFRQEKAAEVDVQDWGWHDQHNTVKVIGVIELLLHWYTLLHKAEKLPVYTAQDNVSFRETICVSGSSTAAIQVSHQPASFMRT